MDTKTCSRCKETKPLSAFSRNRSSKDGYEWLCKTCRAAHMKEWSLLNRKHLAAYAREWRARRKAQEA